METRNVSKGQLSDQRAKTTQGNQWVFNTENSVSGDGLQLVPKQKGILVQYKTVVTLNPKT